MLTRRRAHEARRRSLDIPHERYAPIAGPDLKPVELDPVPQPISPRTQAGGALANPRVISKSDRASLVIGGVFSLILAGVNLPNPLMPVYASHLGIGPGIQGLLFSIYMFALLVVLVIMACWGRLTGSLRTLLIAGAAFSLAADIAMLLGATNVTLLFAGRALSGVAVGLSTGATSATVLYLKGETSRAFIGTGVIAGALAGNLGAAVISSSWGNSLDQPYIVHAFLMSGLGTTLVLILRSRKFPTADRQMPRAPGKPPNSRRSAGFALAGISWLAISAVMALVPAQVAESNPRSTLVLAIAPACSMLATSFLSQQLFRKRIHELTPSFVLIPLLFGYGGICWALFTHSIWALVLFCAVAGVGQGASYNAGLVMVTRDLDPQRQAMFASRYAAVAYASTAIGVLGAGEGIAVFGASATFAILACMFFVSGAISSFIFAKEA